MNKAELIDAVADSAGLSIEDATSATNALFKAITDTLAGGGQVTLVTPGKGIGDRFE